MRTRPRNEKIAASKAILVNVCLEHGVEVIHLLSTRRTKNLVEARVDAIVQMRGAGLSFPEIGWVMNRDHSSVRAVSSPEIRNRRNFAHKLRQAGVSL